MEKRGKESEGERNVKENRKGFIYVLENGGSLSEGAYIAKP